MTLCFVSPGKYSRDHDGNIALLLAHQGISSVLSCFVQDRSKRDEVRENTVLFKQSSFILHRLSHETIKYLKR